MFNGQSKISFHSIEYLAFHVKILALSVASHCDHHILWSNQAISKTNQAALAQMRDSGLV